MNQLKALYSKSVQQTIGKVYEDIDRYKKKYEELPLFKMYVFDRSAYIQYRK
ncbi:hypothetical protein ACOI1C_21170 [Bacillus sp. DJP31]|uniref:hypothetical protein n=1 Tax=Bacillus sp. DJP31 TaxID=3409789 RepID=UPI003BB7AE9D